ncbi:MAG: hypothetical protein ACPG8W_04750 [Candidatus Promineifilaceae bacterium]
MSNPAAPTNRPKQFASISWISTSLAAVIVLLLASARSPWAVVDDAFITYRYAQNLTQGVGFVFNAGEPVLGLTTPLYGLVLAFLHRFAFPDLVLLGYWFGVACWVGLVAAAAALLNAYRLTLAAILVPLLLAVHPAIYSTLGMETLLLTMLMLWTAWAWHGGRFWLTVFLAALTLLTRQDSALFLLILGLDDWRRRGRLPWREGVATTLLTLPWFTYAWWFYGSPLPNSASAKIGQVSLMETGDTRSFVVAAWEIFGAELPFIGLICIAALLCAGIFSQFNAKARAKALAAWWIATWLVLYLAAYTVLGVVNFKWYFVPFIVILILLIGVTVETMLSLVRDQHQTRMQAIAVLVCIGLGLSWLNSSWWASDDIYYNTAYAPLSRWLADNAAPDATVATIEIGAIGYLSNRSIIDTMGLVTTGMTDHQLGWAETLVYALNEFRPNYTLGITGTAWDALTSQWWFQNSYAPVKTEANVTLYKRLPAPILPPYTAEANEQFNDGFTVTGVSAVSNLLTAGEAFELSIRVAVQDTPQHDYILTTYLLDIHTYERLAIVSHAPFDGHYRSSVWQPNDQLAIPVRLHVPDDIPAGAYQIGIAFYEPDSAEYLTLTNAAANSVPDVRLGWLRTDQAPTIQQEPIKKQIVDYKWQNGIVLTQFGVQQRVDANQLDVAFTWQAAEPIERNLKLFVHLLSAEGEIIAQSDSIPVGGRWPTTIWQNDSISDQHQIILPEALPSGPYQLRFGFYDVSGQVSLLNDASSTFILLDHIIIE